MNNHTGGQASTPRTPEVAKVLDRAFKAMGSVKGPADKLKFVTGAATDLHRLGDADALGELSDTAIGKHGLAADDVKKAIDAGTNHGKQAEVNGREHKPAKKPRQNGSDQTQARDQSAGTDDLLAEMNATYATVSVGGKFRVMTFDPDKDHPRQSYPQFSTKTDFCNHVVHPKVTIEEKVAGGSSKKTRMGRGAWWLAHPQHRRFDDIDFAPGSPQTITIGDAKVSGRVIRKANMWSGFAVERKTGDCGLYLNHVREHMCRGSTALYDYTLDWMASGVQHPEDPARATLVLQGVPGAGKGIFAIIYGGLFGRHFLHLMNRDHLVGKFNAHAAEACQFFADEALFVGDARDQDILKTLTSERTKMIERKGIDAITVRSYARLILASNHVHVLRIDPEDRRYCFYDFYTPADMIGAAGAAKRRSYFVPILDQMKNGGSAALMDMLLGRDVSNFNPEDIPQTKGLLEQKLLSAPAGDQLIIEIAQNAVLPGALMSNNSAARSHLDNNRAGLLDHMRINGGKTLDAMSDKALGNILAGWDFVNVRTRDGKVWIAPALPALRDKIAAKYPAVEWDRTPEWGGEPKEE